METTSSQKQSGSAWPDPLRILGRRCPSFASWIRTMRVPLLSKSLRSFISFMNLRDRIFRQEAALLDHQKNAMARWQRRSIMVCPLFLQLFLLPSHGNMPRSFIDTLVQSQSKVVKESRSGTRVCLVGCMHFNPFSTFSARRIAWNLLENQTLKAVVLEMFDDRWHRMLQLHSEGELRLIFDNEMQAVAEIANSSAVPITFADLSDEELDVVFDEVLNETSADLQEAFSDKRSNIHKLFLFPSQ
eukprot:symbB.v1.2.017608.t1/scaffold1377.1/size122625/1